MMAERARKERFAVGFELHTSHWWVIQDSQGKELSHAGAPWPEKNIERLS